MDQTIIPTHRCTKCGALWRHNSPEGTWTVVATGPNPGACCDNAYMGDQIVPINGEITITEVDTDCAQVKEIKPADAMVFTIASATPKEVLVFKPNGEIFVRGEKVDDNKAVYEAVKAWLSAGGWLK